MNIPEFTVAQPSNKSLYMSNNYINIYFLVWDLNICASSVSSCANPYSGSNFISINKNILYA